MMKAYDGGAFTYEMKINMKSMNKHTTIIIIVEKSIIIKLKMKN
jgi:hypothetical protein